MNADKLGCGCGLHESEAEHWRQRLEIDFVKMGVEDADELFRLCELRRRPVPEARRTDYAWLHYMRAEFLKRWAQEDNRALLDAQKPAQSSLAPRKKRRSNFAELQRIRQR